MPIHLFAASQPFAPLFAAAIRRDPQHWIGVGFIVGLVVVNLGLILLFGAWLEKRRTRALAEVAASLGFEFFPKEDPNLRAALDRFPLFGVGRKRKLKNLMRSSSASFELNIFDYSYVTGSGRTQRNHSQTVAYLQSPALQIPNFVLAPKRFWDTVRSLFGQKTIELEGHPVFANAYVLKCNENREHELRQLFSDDVQQFFEDHRGLFCQGSRSQLLLFRADKRAKPDQIHPFMEETLNLLALVDVAGRALVSTASV